MLNPVDRDAIVQCEHGRTFSKVVTITEANVQT